MLEMVQELQDVFGYLDTLSIYRFPLPRVSVLKDYDRMFKKESLAASFSVVALS